MTPFRVTAEEKRHRKQKLPSRECVAVSLHRDYGPFSEAKLNKNSFERDKHL